jgi:hypothetical protein
MGAKMEQSSMELYISICREKGLEPHEKKPEPVYKYYCYKNGRVNIVSDPSEAANYNFKEKFVSNQEEINDWERNKSSLFYHVHNEWKNRIRSLYRMDRCIFDVFYKSICTIIAFDINSVESQAKLCVALKILLDSVATLFVEKGKK